VAALGDPTDQLRQPVTDPAEDEEGRLQAVAVEQVEGARGVALQPGLEAIPLAALDEAVERPDLKIVLQGHGQNVGRAGRHGDHSLGGGREAVAFVPPVVSNRPIRRTIRRPARPSPNGLVTADGANPGRRYSSSSAEASRAGSPPTSLAAPASTASGRS